MSGKIISLKVKNILRLKAVEIDPKGNLVIIGGDNAQGKTSVLNSIMMNLGGKKYVPPEPIHRGEKKGKIVLDIGDYVITQTFTATGTTLKVETAKGVPQKSPQAILDGLVGSLSFDPLAFGNEKPAKQAEILRELVGLDFGDLDEKRSELYAERTVMNRDMKTAKARRDGMPYHEDAPEKEVSITKLVKELEAFRSINRRIDDLQEGITNRERRIEEKYEQLNKLKDDFAKRIASEELGIKEFVEEKLGFQKELEGAIPKDTKPLEEKLEGAEATNRKWRENQTHRDETIALNDLEEAAEELTASITAIDEEKADKLTAANFPVEGLGLGDDGVLFNDLPFEQCSGAEKLKITIAMAISMNPKLRIMLIRDGSLMDDKNLALLAEMAKEADAQVWIERVGDKDKSAVIIEDGQVKKGEEQ